MTVDLSPLYRTAIGFDRLASMLENANRVESAGYPPYNIEVTGPSFCPRRCGSSCYTAVAEDIGSYTLPLKSPVHLTGGSRKLELRFKLTGQRLAAYLP